jgi:WD40 repeat protein
VQCLCLSPDGRTLAVGCRDNTVRLWEVAAGRERAVLEGHTGWAHGLAFSPDGKVLASGAYDGTVRLWDAATGRALATLTGVMEVVMWVALSPDARSLAVGGGGWKQPGRVELWDVSDMLGPAQQAGLAGAPAAAADVRPRAAVEGAALSSAAFSADGRFLALGSSNTVQVWDQAARKQLFILRGHRAWVWTVAFSPDSQTLASACMDGTVKLWDLTTGQCRATLGGHTDKVWDVAFSPDGRALVSASEDNSVRLWDVATGKPQKVLGTHDSHAYAALFTADGRAVVSADINGDVRLWDVASGKVLAHLDGHAAVVRLALSGDGKTLATASHDRTVKLWDLGTRQLLRTLRGHTLPVERAAFSPDGRLLATVSGDFQQPRTPGEVKLWDVASGRELVSLKGHGGPVHGVAFTPDGQTLATASADGTAKLWDVSRWASVTGARATPPTPFVILARVKQGQLLEKDFEIDKAITVYEKVLAEGFQSAELSKHLDELKRKWEPKGEAHKDARQFIYRVWPTLDNAGLKANLPKAEEALAACRKADDPIAAGRLFRATEAHATRLAREADALRPDINVDDEAPAKLIKEVGPGLKKLAAEAQEFLDRKRPAD